MVFLLVYSVILLGVIFRLSAVGCGGSRGVRKLTGLLPVLVGLQFLSLGGVPPLIGFFLKLMVLKVVIAESLSISLGLVLLSFLVLYVYVTLFYQVYCIGGVGTNRAYRAHRLVIALGLLSLMGAGLILTALI